MSKAMDMDAIVAANDDQSALDHLIAAYELTKEPFAKYLIGLALIHEGQKIVQDNPDTVRSLSASARA